MITGPGGGQTKRALITSITGVGVTPERRWLMIPNLKTARGGTARVCVRLVTVSPSKAQSLKW